MLKLVFWDVQHGSSAYIRTPNNNHIVIDLGTGSNTDTNFSPLKHLKYKYKINVLDAVIITHPHRDHLDDIYNLSEFKINSFFRPSHLTEKEVIKGNKSSDLNIIKKYLEINKKYANEFEIDEDYIQFTETGGAKIKIFSPKYSNTSNLNNHSLVVVASYAGSKIIIPGDNEKNSWEDLIDNDDFISAIKNTNILVASHHGREAGFCDELFDYIYPEITIISDGPSRNTSVTDYYTENSQGWGVRYRNQTYGRRYSLTTRADGVIYVEFNKESFGQPTIIAK